MVPLSTIQNTRRADAYGSVLMTSATSASKASLLIFATQSVLRRVLPLYPRKLTGSSGVTRFQALCGVLALLTLPALFFGLDSLALKIATAVGAVALGLSGALGIYSFLRSDTNDDSNT